MQDGIVLDYTQLEQSDITHEQNEPRMNCPQSLDSRAASLPQTPVYLSDFIDPLDTSNSDAVFLDLL